MTKNQNQKPTVKADRLAVVILDFRQWSGTTVLRENDFKLGEEGKLPPKEVIAQLGQKNILDPKLLDRFNTIKSRAIRCLQDNGVSFLGGYAVPLDKAPDVLAQIDGFVRDYEAAKAEFIDRYDSLVEDWIRQNPGFAGELRAAKKSRAEVDSKIYARYSVVKVQPIEQDEQISRFNHDVDGLTERLLKAVAQTARRLSLGTLANAENGKSRVVSIRPVPSLRKISSKLSGLSFLDSGIAPIVDMIESLLAKIPANGRVSGSLFWETQAVVSVLSDVEKMKAIADGSLSLDLWKANFVPKEMRAPEAFELIPERQNEDGSIVDAAAEAAPALDAELQRFIQAHKNGSSGRGLSAQAEQSSSADAAVIAKQHGSASAPPMDEETSFFF